MQEQLTREKMLQVPNLLKPLSLETQDLWRKLLQVFLDEQDNPYGDILTPTQIQIIDIIAGRLYPRVQLILPTQYGKSLCVALGVLLRVTNYKEKWAIIAPTEDKARIIMDYIIDHIFDSPAFSEQLEYHGTKEKMKQERSKVRITFRDGGEVRVYSGNSANTKATRKALMGFGAPNIILDESSLIDDALYSTVKRMVGGSEGTGRGTFLLEIGNPFFRNHFFRTWFGDRYVKIFLDWQGARAEGRYTDDYIEEMRVEAFFDVLYECLFPQAEDVIPNGFRRLVSDLVVDDAMVPDDLVWTYKLDSSGAIRKNQWGFNIIKDDPVLGIDVAGGGKNDTKFVLRFPRHGVAFVASTLDTDDLELVADEAERLCREWNVGDFRICVDGGGVGHGLGPMLTRRGRLVTVVLFGDKSPERAFANMRAWMYWQCRQWLIVSLGKLVNDIGFGELKLIYYKQTSSSRILIEPKKDMIERMSKEGIKVESPDTADAFVLTFVDTTAIVDADDIDVD